MALITCTECGKEFSDKAKACPNCGCPTEYIVDTSLVSQVEALCARPNNNSKDLQPDPIQISTFGKSELLSYPELLDFAFSSILPYINKELANSIINVKSGSVKADDAHFYICCGQRTIGVKVIIDAYPDIYNVGRLFGDDKNEYFLAKRLHEQGYECAVAQIGIGARDPARFSRRIFLKNDGYLFNYTQLRFVKYEPSTTTNTGKSEIRYSLSIDPTYEAWKKIAGFKYEPPKQPERVPGRWEVYGSDFLLQTEKEPLQLSKNMRFWDDDHATENIERLCSSMYIQPEHIIKVSHLACYTASVAHNKIDPKDMITYVCNAVDFITGQFLSDSPRIEQNDILINLKELISRTSFKKKYETECDEEARINYIIYLFVVDCEKYAECLHGDYFAEYKGKRLSSIGYIYRATKDAFIANPKLFGYGQDVVDEIARLQNMNSPQNLEKFSKLKSALITDMQKYCALHKKIVSKRELLLIGKAEEAEIRRYSQNAYEMIKYVDNNFDENLGDSHKRAINSFRSIVTLYQRCLSADDIIVGRQLRGKYGLFERMDDLKESKTRFAVFLQKYHPSASR